MRPCIKPKGSIMNYLYIGIKQHECSDTITIFVRREGKPEVAIRDGINQFNFCKENDYNNDSLERCLDALCERLDDAEYTWFDVYECNGRFYNKY